MNNKTVVKIIELLDRLTETGQVDENDLRSGLHAIAEDKVFIKIVNNSGFEVPEYATPLSSGMDVRAVINYNRIKELNKVNPYAHTNTEVLETKEIVIGAHSRIIIPTGLFVEIPEGYEIQVRPRSGMAIKQGITVLNTPGTIDADYRGEIGVILFNTNDWPIPIAHGDKIAQLVVSKVEKAHFVPVKDLVKTVRGEGGFGHTGK